MDFISNLFGTDKNQNFFTACKSGQIETVEKLLKSNKIEINWQDHIR